MSEIEEKWSAKLEPVFPANIKESDSIATKYSYSVAERQLSPVKIAKPRVLIPVFPGTNCEYDSAKAFENAGAILV